MLASKQISHSSTKVHLIFQAMTWAGVLLVPLFSLNLACGSKLWQKAYTRESKAKWLWQDFPVSPTYRHLCFPAWNNGPYGSAEKGIRSRMKKDCIFAFATYSWQGWTLSRCYCRLQFAETKGILQRSWERSTQKDLSGWYFIRKHIWVKMKILDTTLQK